MRVYLPCHTGKIVYFGGIDEVLGQLRTQKEVSVKVKGDQELFKSLFESEESVAEVSYLDEFIKIKLNEGVDDYSFVVRHVVEQGGSLLALNEENVGLEKVFMDLTKGNKNK